MKVKLRKICFENIKIKNNSLVGANLVRCNLNESQLENLDISGDNLNEAQLFNCQWKKLRIHELHKLDSYNNTVYSLCFSPDGIALASGSRDNSILLWDIKTGKQKSKLNGHSAAVYSLLLSRWYYINIYQQRQHYLFMECQDWTINLNFRLKLKDKVSLFQSFLQNNNFSEKGVNSNLTILAISQYPNLQAQKALIFKGEFFLNHSGIELRKLFQQEGSYILESQLQILQNIIQN
ncbi:unnamed protein product [Paramecium pentaurelia]|uniref:Uncharacterized protein n=1 Tax=Paramecium pentaurelia TaxID=43138 RepID=A0A8S1Y6K7_9CILI|nr:unnamed protein product [Paramecium pentaurelia]